MKNFLPAAAFAAALFLGGCNYNSEQLDPTLVDFFPNDKQQAKITQIAELQAAAGARYDAMLYGLHFDGPALNSLGEDKLALMLKDDDAPGPVLVYLSVDEKGPTSADRKAAVVTFLKDKGLEDGQIKVAYGDNPATRTPAARALANQSKLEGQATSGPGSVTSTTGASGGTAGGEPVGASFK
ncbi:MAG TPA: hypothetical protein VEA69_03535 [Tepidisphaeraceae bacterium]|nr:hypothetical protein [Tepidisphaeraceae bacterium]